MLSKFQHILIPLDFTESNDSVLEAAHDIVSTTGARVTLIHVVEPMESGDDPELQAFTQRLSNEAETHLLERAQTFSNLDINVTCENRVGKRNAEIVSFSMDENVDLIIMNSHRVTPETTDRNSFSLSHQVALLAPCAILMLKS